MCVGGGGGGGGTVLHIFFLFSSLFAGIYP